MFIDSFNEIYKQLQHSLVNHEYKSEVQQRSSEASEINKDCVGISVNRCVFEKTWFEHFIESESVEY